MRLSVLVGLTLLVGLVLGYISAMQHSNWVPENVRMINDIELRQLRHYVDTRCEAFDVHPDGTL